MNNSKHENVKRCKRYGVDMDGFLEKCCCNINRN